MSLYLLCLLPLLGAPDVEVPAGPAIALDGKMENGEWEKAFVAEEPLGENGKVRLALLRAGPWLQIGISADRAYMGDALTLHVTDDVGAWMTVLSLTIGEPTQPPALWKRASPEVLRNPRLLAECPRAVRVRTALEAPERWSAEFSVAMSALGIGRGDRREFRCLIVLSASGPDKEPALRVPRDAGNPFEFEKYTTLVSPDGWGARESWPPVPAEASREFDDHEFLYGLYVEHSQFITGDQPERPLMGSAVFDRSEERIRALRAKLDAGRVRNPTLPAWTYFTARLLHEGNYVEEARELLAALPAPLQSLDAFAILRAEHCIDSGEWEQAIEICQNNPDTPFMRDQLRLALAGRRAEKTELEALERDKNNPEQNPLVKLHTSRGVISCELFEDDAPHAVANFLDLVLRRRYFDGMRVHLARGGQFVALGDPRTRSGATEGADGPSWRLRPDAAGRPLLRGRLVTVPVPGDVFHGSHFAILVAPRLRGPTKEIAFGRVIDGMGVVDALEATDLLTKIEIVRRRNHAYDPLPSRLR